MAFIKLFLSPYLWIAPFRQPLTIQVAGHVAGMSSIACRILMTIYGIEHQ